MLFTSDMPSAEQVHIEGRFVGWVQRVGGRWFARSVETGSKTTQHDTRAAAVVAVRCPHADRHGHTATACTWCDFDPAAGAR